MKKLTVCDITLREFAKSGEVSLTFKENIEIARLLDRVGVSAIELAPIQNERADSLLVKSIALAVRKSAVALPCALSTEGVDAAWNALRDAKTPILQIIVPTSTVGMEYHTHKKPAAMLALITELVSRTASLCERVEFVALDATRSEREFLCSAVDAAISAGAKTVTLCDSAGIMLPDEFAALIRELREKTQLASVALCVQCSDELSLANACALAAIQNGADGIKVCSKDGGCVSLEEFSALIRARGAELNVSSAVRITELSRASRQIDWLTHSKRSSTSAFDGGSSKAADVEGVLVESDGLGAVKKAVAKLGYDLSEDDLAAVYEQFKTIAHKKDVGASELDAIVASAALQVPPTYTVESFVINSGNVITATAHIRLNKNGSPLEGIAIGDGPVDASFLAIEQIIGHHYELDDFQIKAVTEGHEAMGSSVVRLRSNGKVYSGRGISTDIIGASIKAYINALNKIAFEET